MPTLIIYNSCDLMTLVNENFIRATIFAFLTFLLIACSAIAFKTLKTVEYPFGFVAQTTAGVWYSQDITISPPDGINRILSSEIHVNGDFQADTTLTIEVESASCSPASITTPNQNIANYDAYFDCSELTEDRQEGTYTVRLKTDKVAQNIYARAIFTYQNNPKVDLPQIYENVKAKLGMHGTEYVVGDNATIFLQLYENTTAINDASCLLDVFYPDKSQWKEDTPMSYLPSSDGLYYYDLVVPEQIGVYMLSATCGYRVEEGAQETSDAFQIVNGTVDSGGHTDTHTSNNNYHVMIEEDDDEIPNLLAIYNFTGISGNDSMIELDIHLEYQWEYFSLFFWSASDEDLGAEIYNFTGDSWYLIPQDITGATSDTNWDYALTVSDLNDFVGNGTIMIAFIDFESDSNTDYFRIDHLYIQPKYQVGEIWDRIRGSGEMHVSPTLNSTLEQAGVWGKLRSIQDEITSVNDTVKSVNSTIMTKLHSLQDDFNYTWNFINNISFEVNYTYFDEQFSTTWSNQTTLYNMMIGNNNSVFNKLHSLQDDFNQTWVNQTKIWNILLEINSTEAQAEINYTIIEGWFNDTWNNQTTIYDTMLLNNSALMTKLYGIQDEISTVNDTVKNSTETWGNLINNNLNWWGNHLNSTMNYWGGTISSTLTTIQNTLTNIQADIVTVNQSVITYGMQINDTTQLIFYNETLDLTIWQKLVGIQNEIAQVNQTVTIMGNVTTTGPGCYDIALCVSEYLIALERYRII